MPKINQATLINLEVPIPPPKEQDYIVSKLDNYLLLFEDLKNESLSNMEKIDLLDEVIEQEILYFLYDTNHLPNPR